MEPAYGIAEGLAIDLEAETKSESGKYDSTDAPASADDDSEESTYSVDYERRFPLLITRVTTCIRIAGVISTLNRF